MAELGEPIEGSFTSAPDQSKPFMPFVGGWTNGGFNVTLTGGGSGSVQLTKSFDNGQTWCQISAAGTQLYAWTYAGTNLSEAASETERGVLYRLECTALSSGPINYRISQ